MVLAVVPIGKKGKYDGDLFFPFRALQNIKKPNSILQFKKLVFHFYCKVKILVI